MCKPLSLAEIKLTSFIVLIMENRFLHQTDENFKTKQCSYQNYCAYNKCPANQLCPHWKEKLPTKTSVQDKERTKLSENKDTCKIPDNHQSFFGNFSDVSSGSLEKTSISFENDDKRKILNNNFPLLKNNKTSFDERKLTVNAHLPDGEDTITTENCDDDGSRKTASENYNPILDLQKTFSFNMRAEQYSTVSSLKDSYFIIFDPIPCSACGQRFVDNKELESHFKKEHIKSPSKNICTVCTKSFKTASILRNHMFVHRTEKPHACNQCSKQYTYLFQLKTHLLVHSGEKPFSCDVCEKRFSSDGDLKRHSMIHSKQNPFVCKVCSKPFSDKFALSTHMWIHTGEKPFNCSDCSKRFSNVTCLKRHLRVHTGEKPFTCEVCNKHYSDNSTLKMHLLVHFEGKTFTCDFCPKKFSSPQHLKVHHRVHTGEKPYVCEKCHRCFSTKSYLTYHLKTIHSNNKS